MKKNLFKYIFSEGPIKTSSILKSDRKKNEPLLPGIEEPEGQALLKDFPTAAEDYKRVRKKELKLDKINLKKRRNELVKQLKKEQDPQPLLFNQKTLVTNQEKDWRAELSSLNKMIRRGVSSDKNQNAYSRSLRLIINKFFSLGLKMPKRRIYIPLTRNINFAQVENLNKRSYYDVMMNIKRSEFVDMEPIDSDIVNYLERFGYQLTKIDYFANRCRNKNNKMIPIDMELKRIQEIDVTKKKAFIMKTKDQKLIEIAKEDIEKRDQYDSIFLDRIENIKNYLNIMLDKVIIITWSPLSILSQSTGTQWQSCMSYHEAPDSESNVKYIPPSISSGVFIAWLVDIDDKKIMRPIARTLLKPRKVEVNSNKTRIAWWPSSIYTSGGQGNVIDLFRRTLINYMIYKQKNVFVPDQEAEVKSELYYRQDVEGEVYHDKEQGYTITNFNSLLNQLKKEINEDKDRFHKKFKDKEYLMSSVFFVRYAVILNVYDIDSQKIRTLIEDTDFIGPLRNVLKNETIGKEAAELLVTIFEKIGNMGDYKLLSLLFSKLDENQIDNFVFNIFRTNGINFSNNVPIFDFTFKEMITNTTFLNYFLNTYFFKRLETRKDFLERCVKYARFLLKLADDDKMFFRLIKTDIRFGDMKDADYGTVERILKLIKNFEIFKIFFDINVKQIGPVVLSRFFNEKFRDETDVAVEKVDQNKKYEFLRYVLIEKKQSIEMICERREEAQRGFFINHILDCNDFELIKKFYDEMILQALEALNARLTAKLFSTKTEKEYQKYYDLFSSRPETKFAENLKFNALSELNVLLYSDKQDKTFFKNLYKEFLDARILRLGSERDAVFYGIWTEYRNFVDMISKDSDTIYNNLITGEALDYLLSHFNKEFFSSTVFETLSKERTHSSGIYYLSAILREMIDRYDESKSSAKKSIEKIITHFTNLFPDLFSRFPQTIMLILINFDINLIGKMQIHEADNFLKELITSPYHIEGKINFLKKIIENKITINFSIGFDKIPSPTGSSSYSSVVFYYLLKCINMRLFKGINKKIPIFYLAQFLISKEYLTENKIKVNDFISEVEQFEFIVKPSTFYYYAESLFNTRDNFDLGIKLVNIVIKDNEDFKQKFVNDTIFNLTLQNTSQTEDAIMTENMLEFFKSINANDDMIMQAIEKRIAAYIPYYVLKMLNVSNRMFDIFLKIKTKEDYITKTLNSVIKQEAVNNQTLVMAMFMIKIFKVTNMDRKKYGEMLARGLGYIKEPEETLRSLRAKLSPSNYQFLKNILG